MAKIEIRVEMDGGKYVLIESRVPHTDELLSDVDGFFSYMGPESGDRAHGAACKITRGVLSLVQDNRDVCLRAWVPGAADDR